MILTMQRYYFYLKYKRCILRSEKSSFPDNISPLSKTAATNRRFGKMKRRKDLSERRYNFFFRRFAERGLHLV